MMDSQIIESLNDAKVRRSVARLSHEGFFGIYLGNHIQYPSAPFHRELFALTEDNSVELAVIVAFRGSAKTTIMGLSYPLWAILGSEQRKFVLIVSQTQNQSRQILANIKMELETNELIRKDFGPFTTEADQWSAESIVLTKYGARITAVSVESSVRGLKHGAFRPDLMIFDDVQDLNSVQTRDQRNKTYNWVVSDAMAAGDPQRTKVIVIGNLLHEDSIVMRFKEEIESDQRSGIFKSYPFLLEDGTSSWSGRFPDAQSIEKLKKRVGNEVVYAREYLLHILSNSERVVHPEWIVLYEELPKVIPSRSLSDYLSEEQLKWAFRGIIIGVDLAISQKQASDYTSIVTGFVYGFRNEMKIYILPNIINAKMTFPETRDAIASLCKSYDQNVTVCVESVGYQDALAQALDELGINTVSVKVGGYDKRTRLSLVSEPIQKGKVLFPKIGADETISQMVNFGSERYDDLADAVVMLLNGFLEMEREPISFEIC